MQTLVVNFWAGPGAGKSTLAAGAFAALKQEMRSVELVREYVKDWAWRGEPVKRWDQLYLTAKQLRRESCLYGKVEIVLTDSPIGLGLVYTNIYQPADAYWVCAAVSGLMAAQRTEGIRHLDLFVKRSKPYVQAGRFEGVDAAARVDSAIRTHLGATAHEVSTLEEVLSEIERASK